MFNSTMLTPLSTNSTLLLMASFTACEEALRAHLLAVVEAIFQAEEATHLVAVVPTEVGVDLLQWETVECMFLAISNVLLCTDEL
jgi:hypothetical protein